MSILDLFSKIEKDRKRQDEMKIRLIVGLGNPGLAYEKTRHNIGFMVIDSLKARFNIDVNKLKYKSLYGETIYNNEKILLVKPQTYMNLSGECISQWVNFYKLDPAEVIVIYDDISLPLGVLRIKERGSAGGHNGMKNMIKMLATEEFIRVRIGIGEKPSYYDLADYVTSKFLKNEEEPIKIGIKNGADAVMCLLNENLASTMNKFNNKKPE